MPTIITRAEKKRKGDVKNQSQSAVLIPKCCTDNPERFTVYKHYDCQICEKNDELNRDAVYE